MLTRFTTLFLMFAIVGANFQALFIYAGFSANQKYIASTLCENRAKPWLHCNGKCYLMKKVKQAEEKERSEERQTQKSLFQEVFFAVQQPIKFHTRLLQVIHTPYHSAVLAVQPGAVFRPPQAI